MAIFKQIWREFTETYRQSTVGTYAALFGKQLHQDEDEDRWISQASPYKYMRNDRRENASDYISVGKNQLISTGTSAIGVAVLAGIKELSVATISIYAVPILLTQAFVRVLFNTRELEGAQNRNLNKKVKTSVNISIMIAYIVGAIFTFAYAALATCALPLIAFSVSTVRAIQGAVYGVANGQLRKETDRFWDPLQYERVLVQEIKRKSQFVGSGSTAILAGVMAFGGYTIGIPVVFGLAIAIGVLSATVTLYLGLREFPPFNRWFRARSIFAPQLNPYDETKNKGYVQNASNTLSKDSSPPTAHQAFLRDEAWWLKKERLENGSYYDMQTPPENREELSGKQYTRKTRFLFHLDIYQEIEAIFQCHPKEKEPGETSHSITFKEKKDLCKAYILRLITEHRNLLVKEQEEASTINPWKRFHQILNLKVTANVEQIKDKIAFLDCLERLVKTDNGQEKTGNGETRSTEMDNSPFREALNGCNTYQEVHACLLENAENMRNVCGGAFRKFTGCEVFLRILSPAPPSTTHTNRGYFCWLEEQKSPEASTASGSTQSLDSAGENSNNALSPNRQSSPPSPPPSRVSEMGSPNQALTFDEDPNTTEAVRPIRFLAANRHRFLHTCDSNDSKRNSNSSNDGEVQPVSQEYINGHC